MTPLPPRASAIPARRRTGGMTLIEIAVVIVVMGILLGVAVTHYGSTQRDLLDQTGVTLLGAAVVDARAVASVTGYRYDPAPGQLATSLNTVATRHQSAGVNVLYIPDPSPAPAPDSDGVSLLKVSAAALSATTVAFAVMTSANGPADGHCLLAVDSLRTGTRFAVMNDALGSTRNACSAAVVVSCASQWDATVNWGTSSDPHEVSAADPCVATSAP